ncbi:hypothetical protein, partial [Rhodopseudomonas sp. B29]|uniref:hypothetical protein n=1 Tax=Rhodopseudomonas sp. B29 TaxID=95607 RepID=UPI00059265B2
MFTVMGGYLVFAQMLVGIIVCNLAPVPAAPMLFNYAAVALTLLVVWMVTSPRLELPYKPLLGIAIVIVPMGYEELGTLTNIQWVLPIGAFALLFMRPPASIAGAVAEAAFLGVTALSGPFSIFLTPLFAARAWMARDAANRRRLIVLSCIVALGALIQIAVISRNPSILNLVAPTPYSWTVWVNLPFSQITTTFGPRVSQLFRADSGAALGLGLLLIAVVLAWLPPYRAQKLFMLAFGLAIVLSGMYKFRAALETQYASNRYFYAASVFALWFICCLSGRRYVRTVFAGLVLVTELLLLPLIANTPRFAKDLEWPVWASYLNSGLAVIIPTTPTGFYLSLPASKDGPLAQFRSWPDRNIN